MRLKEESYPIDARGRPDLRCYTDSLEYYIQMYQQQLDTLQGKNEETHLVFARRVHGTWGLIAQGAAAIPYALGLLRHPEPEAREDGAAILAEIGKDDRIVDKLLGSLKSETDTTARDSLIVALGKLKNRKAIPALAVIIRNEAVDGDTRHTAVESLGVIVRKRFLRHANPTQAALAWLDSHAPSAE